MTTRTLSFAPALLLALNAGATCEPPPVSARPGIPNGATATETAMISAQQQVAGYVSLIESYLDCRADRLPTLIHDGYVQRAETVAAAFNAELGKYRIREGELAQH